MIPENNIKSLEKAINVVRNAIMNAYNADNNHVGRDHYYELSEILSSASSQIEEIKRQKLFAKTPSN